MLCKKQVLLQISYVARNIYEIEAATSRLSYIKDLIFLEKNIVWFWNSLDVRSTDSLVDLCFHIRGSFFNNFLHQFLEKSA